MINSQQLQKQTSAFLKKEVLAVGIAVGIFDVSLNFGGRTLAPVAAGIGTYMGTKFIEKKMGHEGTGAKVAAAVVGVAGAAGTKHLMYIHDAKMKGLTPVMICAITKTKIYLLDWKGNHNKGTGPTRILFEFSCSQAKVKNRTRGRSSHSRH